MPIGGGQAFPLHFFDGALPTPIRICYEIWDCSPDDWSAELEAVYGHVWHDPVSWAREVAGHGAEALYLRLKRAAMEPSADLTDVATDARRIVEASGLPAFVVGCGEPDVDSALLPLVAGELAGRRVALGNAESDTYHGIAAAAAGGGHAVIAYTPMDVSLAKQLNVLLAQAGMPEGDIIMDPTCSAVGYSFEYAYTVFERNRLAALAQNDTRMQAPLIANVGQETWQVKESRASEDDLPGHGERLARGVLWETVTALNLVLAGADVVVIRHPESARLLRSAMIGLSERTGAWD